MHQTHPLLFLAGPDSCLVPVYIPVFRVKIQGHLSYLIPSPSSDVYCENRVHLLRIHSKDNTLLWNTVQL